MKKQAVLIAGQFIKEKKIVKNKAILLRVIKNIPR